MKGFSSRIVLPIVVVIIGLLVGAYLVGTRPKAYPNPPAERIRPVNIVSALHQNIRPELLVYGEIKAGREAELRSMVAGRLVYLDPSYRSGAYVEAGRRLVEVDPFEYELAVREQRADVAEAQAKLRELQSKLEIQRRLLVLLDEQTELRKRDHVRAENLKKKNQTSEKAYDDTKLAVLASRQERLQAEQTIDGLVARIEQQRAALDRSEAQLDRSERDLIDTTITAPFSGFLQDIIVATGKRVAVGESIGRLIDADGLEARFELPNADYSRLVGTVARSLGKDNHPLSGTAIRATWRLGSTTYIYDGMIERVGAEIDSTTGGVVLYARITGGPIEILRPGAFVEVSLPDVYYNDIIALPETAVSSNGMVYVVEKARLVERQVEVVYESGAEIYIKSDIPAGASIVVEQFPDIGPGISVSPHLIQ